LVIGIDAPTPKTIKWAELGRHRTEVLVPPLEPYVICLSLSHRNAPKVMFFEGIKTFRFSLQLVDIGFETVVTCLQTKTTKIEIVE
jgi:hypothetical protein